MTLREYKTKLRELRPQINHLSFEMGSTYTTDLETLTKLLNECLNGDLTPSDNDDIEYSLDIDLYKYPEKIFLTNTNYTR